METPEELAPKPNLLSHLARYLRDSRERRRLKYEWKRELVTLRRADRRGMARSFAPTIAALVFSGVVTVVLFIYRDALATLGAWSYLGVFLTELVNSASIIIPLPAHNYAIIVSLTLNPLYLGIVGGIGAGLGEMTGYLLGSGGRNVLSDSRWLQRFQALASRNFGLALFVFAFMPAPFDFAGITAGAVAYPVWKFLLIVIAGKVLKVTLLVLTGYQGLRWLLGLLGG